MRKESIQKRRVHQRGYGAISSTISRYFNAKAMNVTNDSSTAPSRSTTTGQLEAMLEKCC